MNLIKRLKKGWAANFLVSESVTAIIIAIAFAIWVYSLGGKSTVDLLLKGNRPAVYGAVAAIFGSLLGFVITAVSIVLGYAAHDRLAVIRDSQQYPVMWQVFTSSIRWLGFATVIALIGLIFDRDDITNHIVLCTCVWAVSIATFRLCRCVWVLEMIIVLVTKPDTNPKTS